MKDKICFIVGIIWALPVTFLSFLFHVMPLWLFGVYVYGGWDETAWIWKIDVSRPGGCFLARFMCDRWRRWGGLTLGNIVIIKEHPMIAADARARVFVHEKEHVRQIMLLGVFQPILYALNYVVGRFVLRNTDGYYDNLFEIDSRRRAGELVDIVGVINKLKEPNTK